jgi:hypothetical protein
MKRRRTIVIVTVLAGLSLLLVGLRLFASRLVMSRIVSSVHDRYGVDLVIDDLSLSLGSGSARARGLRILDAGTVIAEAEEVELSASIRDILGKNYDFHELVVTRPVLHVVVEPGHSTNLSRIFARRKRPDSLASSVLLREARVVGGRCVVHDAQTDSDHPALLTFDGVGLELSDLQVSGRPRSSAIGDIRLDALFVQKNAPARVTLVGWTPGLTGKPTIALHAAITGLDLAQLPQYVKESTRAVLGGDLMHLYGTLRTNEGIIEDGAIAAEVVANGDKHALRFGGTTSDIVFDKESKLATLFRLPFVGLGRLGDVALTSTWGAAVDLGTGLYDAGDAVVSGVAGTLGSMARLDPLGALEATGAGLIGGVEALGGGLLGGVKRFFGGGKSAADKAKQGAQREVEFTALHVECRRAMLEAALLSARDSSGARKQRIALELETVSSAAPGAARSESSDGEGS